MIDKRSLKATGGALLAAVSLSGFLALSACEERPYPQPVKSYSEPAKAPPPPAQLAGAPTPPPPPAYEPPKAPEPPPPAPTYAPRVYDNGAVVAMAPIPNPEYGGGHRKHGHYTTEPSYGGETGYAPPKPVYHKPVKAPPSYAATPPTPPKTYKPAPPKPTYAAKPPVPPKPEYKKPEPPKPTYAAKPPVPPKPEYKKPEPPKPVYAAKPVAKPAPENTNMAHAKDAAKSAEDKTKAAAVAATGAAAMVADKAKGVADKAKTEVAKAAAPVGNAADRASHLAALQAALTDAISKNAALKAPDKFTANQPVDVTLTVPASFADTLKSEAQKNGLSDAAASANLTAVLSGDGFSVTPDETLSLPLTPGQATEFKWTVSAMPGAKGPLHADVGVDLLGAGSDTLTLGSVQKQAGLGIKWTPRVIGLGLLVLIALLLVAWLARGRGPTRSAAARRASRAARNGPMDMGQAH